MHRSSIKKVKDLLPGDVLIGTEGGWSVVQNSADKAASLGYMRIETEHGHLYLEPEAQVKVIVRPSEEADQAPPQP